jgi:uncharacterized damage-inducible protein DinB
MKVSDLSSYPSYFKHYFELVGNNSLEQILEKRMVNALDFYQEIPANKWTYSYEEGKWSMQKVLQHVLDAEAIFLYRAISVARGEKQSLPGWNENEYANNIQESSIDITRLFRALGHQMNLTKYYFSTFSSEEMEQIGIINNHETSVGAMGFAIAGHEIHHRNIIKERYF